MIVVAPHPVRPHGELAVGTAVASLTRDRAHVLGGDPLDTRRGPGLFVIFGNSKLGLHRCAGCVGRRHPAVQIAGLVDHEMPASLCFVDVYSVAFEQMSDDFRAASRFTANVQANRADVPRLLGLTCKIGIGDGGDRFRRWFGWGSVWSFGLRFSGLCCDLWIGLRPRAFIIALCAVVATATCQCEQGEAESRAKNEIAAPDACSWNIHFLNVPRGQVKRR